MNTMHQDNKTKWSIDNAHSEIGFKVRHLMIAHVKGAFKTFDASIYTDGKNFETAEIDLWIDTSSISTGDLKRDEHLMSDDFFDVSSYKQISFISSTMGKADASGKCELWGILTIKGIAQNIVLEAQFGGIMKDPWGNEKAGFTVTGKIKRSDWGLRWNSVLESGGLMIGDEISIICEMEFINAGVETLTMELNDSFVNA